MSLSAHSFGQKRATGNASMKIVYAVKNYHPAHAGIIAALHSEGHATSLLFWNERESEVKDGANYVPVLTSQIESRTFKLPRNPLFKPRQIRYPLIFSLRDQLRLLQPDVLLVYGDSWQQRLVGFVGKCVGATVIELVDKPKRVKAWLKFFPLWVKSRTSPRRRIHNGFFGRFGEPFYLGPGLGSTWLAPYPVDPVPGERQPRPPGERVRVLCMGSANPRNSRLEYVLEAVARAGIHNKVDLTIYQRPWRAEALIQRVRALEADLGLPETRIRSDVADKDLRKLFYEFDLLVYPSRNNPYGQTVGEALAHGLPVLCSDSIGAQVLIASGENGAIFRTADLDDFAQHLRELVTDVPRLQKMSHSALERARLTHSSSAWLRTFNALL